MTLQGYISVPPSQRSSPTAECYAEMVRQFPEKLDHLNHSYLIGLLFARRLKILKIFALLDALSHIGRSYYPLDR